MYDIQPSFLFQSHKKKQKKNPRQSGNILKMLEIQISWKIPLGSKWLENTEKIFNIPYFQTKEKVKKMYKKSSFLFIEYQLGEGKSKQVKEEKK